MKRILLTVTILLATLTTQAQTNQEELTAANTQLRAASMKMTQLINYIDSAYSDQTAFLIMLKSSQNAWNKYLEAQLKMKYPNFDMSKLKGNMAICATKYMTLLVNNRINLLQEWKDGAKAGDACNGSVKP